MCCKITARTWTVVGIVVDIVILALVFVSLAACFIALLTTKEEESTSTSSDPEDPANVWANYFRIQMKAILLVGKTLIFMLMIINAMAFVFPAMALNSVKSENVCYLSFWIALKCVWILLSILRLAAAASSTNLKGYPSLFIAIFLAFDLTFLVATIRFRKQILIKRAVRKVLFPVA